VITWLLDTGPLVSYLDAADPAHGGVAECLDDFSGRLVTTGAVITEAMHFVGTTKGGAAALAEFVDASGLQVYELCQPPELREAAKLMAKYSDTPMDFADATLVLLAEALYAHDIVTLDRRGFSAYRTRRRRHFRLVLEAERMSK
jgi:predicted nucleic acid-binding protein